jgi:hypothetical protein
MDAEPKLPAPVYTPEVAADAIVFCLEHPRRDITVGAGGKMIGVMGLAPRLADKYMEATQFTGQKRSGQPADAGRPDTLDEPVPNSGRLRGDHEGHVATSSVYTTISRHPLAAVVGVAALGAAFALAGRSRASRRRNAELGAGETRPELADLSSEGPPLSAAALTVDPIAEVTTDSAVSVEVLA